MKTMTLAAMATIFIICGGCQSTKVCKCPSETIYLNTEAGLLKFEAGELDQEQPYILHQKQVDEIMQELEKLYLKQNGGAS